MKRKHEIIGIENGNVLRICALIDKIKSHQEYVIVPNVVSSLLKASEIKLIGKREPINFHQSKRPWKRFMQAVRIPEDILYDVLSALIIVFSKCVHIVVKLKFWKTYIRPSPYALTQKKSRIVPVKTKRENLFCGEVF